MNALGTLLTLPDEHGQPTEFVVARIDVSPNPEQHRTYTLVEPRVLRDDV